MELVDCHSHSAYSGHGEGSVHAMVARAEALGLAVYAQTEHLWLPEELDPSHGDSMSREDMGRYVADIEAERERLEREGSPLALVEGVEADWLPGRAEELSMLCEPFEYVVGSVHYVEGLSVDCANDAGAWEAFGVDGTWARYLEAWLEMAGSGARIDCFAHPDLPKKFGSLPSFPLEPWFEEMASAAAAAGAMVEVNTAGLRKPVGEAYPSPDLLEAFCRHGVECTVGCDAHRPAEVAFGVERAYELMRRAGYEYVSVPRSDGSRRRIRLEE